MKIKEKKKKDRTAIEMNKVIENGGDDVRVKGESAKKQSEAVPILF